MRPMPRLFQKVGNKIMKIINKAAFVCGRQLVSSVVEQRYCNVFKGGACECPGQVWGQCSDTDMGMCLLITEILESRLTFFFTIKEPNTIGHISNNCERVCVSQSFDSLCGPVSFFSRMLYSSPPLIYDVLHIQLLFVFIDFSLSTH